MPAAHSAAVICLALSLALAWAHARSHARAQPPLKLAASAAFLVVALAAGALDSDYGRLVLVALGLGAVGDALLLSRRSPLFLAGLGTFLVAHAVYAIAFALQPQDLAWLIGGAIAMAVVAVIVLRWLWARLRSVYQLAVPAYVLAIGAMVATAMGTAAATGHAGIAAGALAFAASDVAVARERFVVASPANKIWGLPLYYLGKVLLALSVALS
ncbi:lysoplasmalogenase [Agrilutibacter solisilvae]|uniref:Lysoplasmalogenase n=1 Tax=Agrilutibacter solisilvae TaxID=2763317 RepID=A0A975ATN0_9GAMM|nr:lysoplasmalogenase [Lysobacter solisilvae]QSX79478.1 lysoplasmalogenase [Lysobacter solisilvae]